MGVREPRLRPRRDSSRTSWMGASARRCTPSFALVETSRWRLARRAGYPFTRGPHRRSRAPIRWDHRRRARSRRRFLRRQLGRNWGDRVRARQGQSPQLGMPAGGGRSAGVLHLLAATVRALRAQRHRQRQSAGRRWASCAWRKKHRPPLGCARWCPRSPAARRPRWRPQRPLRARVVLRARGATYRLLDRARSPRGRPN